MKHIIALLVLLSALTACGPQQLPVTSTPSVAPSERNVEDLDSLVDSLHTAGAEVELGDMVEQAFFSVKGQIVKVNGSDVQVFEYENAEAMEAGAEQVAPDGGSVGTSMITWVDTPHFYKTGRILVLYVGDDAATTDLLKSVLGEQFAGR